jgi:protocatechuate 3,4-dioxygenase alpha subunit
MSDALGLTPSQTAGPYLSIGLLRELATPQLVESGDPRAIRIRGRLTDGAGAGVTDGMVEIWQANAAGRYRHAADDRADIPLEDGFLGFARSGTQDDGRFDLVTVKPGPVPWPEGGLQAPHISVCVLARGLLKAAMTRMYFPDEVEANEADPVLSRLTPEQRDTLVAVSDDEGVRFDIRLQGAGQTTFFAV